MPLPTTFQALRAGAGAARRSAWLVAPALLVTLARSALLWTGPLFALGMARAGIAARLEGGALLPGEILGGAAEALLAPRTLYTGAGLVLAGLLLSGALRVAYLAGALPTLGAALAGGPWRPRFAEGFTFGFARMLGAALLGLVLELTAALYAAAALLATVLLVLHPPASPLPAAAAGAAALTSAVLFLALAGLAADATLARAGLAGEPPAQALAAGLGRVLRRPAVFLVAAGVMGIASAMALGTVQTVRVAVLGPLGAGPLLALGPRAMLGVAAAVLAAALELWRLGTVAVLACASDDRA